MESSEELVVALFPLAGNRGGCKQGTCNAKQTMITYLYDSDSGSGPVSKRCGSGTGSASICVQVFKLRFNLKKRSL
jgi:hypothetical protein